MIDDPRAGAQGRGTFRSSHSGSLVVLTTTLSKRFDHRGLLFEATFLDLCMRQCDGLRKVQISIRTRWHKIIGSNERAVTASSFLGVGV